MSFCLQLITSRPFSRDPTVTWGKKAKSPYEDSILLAQKVRGLVVLNDEIEPSVLRSTLCVLSSTAKPVEHPSLTNDNNDGQIPLGPGIHSESENHLKTQ
jgi:hypothetical protein